MDTVPFRLKLIEMNQLQTPNDLSPTNPFSTRFVSPGSLNFRSESADIDDLAGRFAACGFVGQIVGGHGSGKSTLVHTLIKYFATAPISLPFGSLETVSLVICSKKRIRERVVDTLKVPNGVGAGSKRIYLLDGWELLGWSDQLGFLHDCKINGNGVLLTTHRVTRNVPVLFQVDPTVEVLLNLVDQLAPNFACLPGVEEVVKHVFDQEKGNIRECFMRIYDHYEKIRRGAPS